MSDQPNNPIRDQALRYAGWQWLVFPVGRDKVPLIKWKVGASLDPAQITQWWCRWPDANVGIVTGSRSGVVVIDVDGPKGRALLAQYGALPETLQVTSGRPEGGTHHYFLVDRNQPIKGRLLDGLELKADGQYVVGVGSVHASGAVYRWANRVMPVALPAEIVVWFHERKRGPRAVDRAEVLEPRPAWLVSIPDLTERALPPDDRQYSFDEVVNALSRIPASCDIDTWLNQARSLHDWDSGNLGLWIFLAWSRSSTTAKHQTPEAQNKAVEEWHNIKKDKPGIKMRRISSLFHDAAQYPIRPRVDSQQTAANSSQINGFHHESQTFAQDFKVKWIDTDEDGNPRPTCTNARVAIRGLGVCCEKDTFHEKLIVGGHAIQQWAGELSDDAVLMMRQLIKEAFRFDPGEKPTRDAAVQLCLANQYDPIVDYLENLQWDGADRLGGWLHAYMAAPDNPLTREFARLVLVAAVRRAYRPGAKFDEILVLEGPEGKGKSAALRVMAGEENFSDAKVLGLSDREQFEATGGIWIHEISELNGMRRAEVEHVKAFASRQEDRARPAYGRFRIDRPRRCVFVATTNTQTYLRSDTGDRRFWPVETGRIDVEGLALARDQLWAEAVARHKNNESIRLDSRWWSEAKKLQTSRQELDAWHDEVSAHVDKKQLRDTSITQVLTEFLRLEISRVGQTEQNRAARVLRMLGFERYQKRDGNSFSWRYRLP